VERKRNTAEETALALKILANCRNELMSLFPHLDLAFSALNDREDRTISLCAADGEHLCFSPVSLLRLYADDPAVLRRGYLHMLLHCLYLHPFFEEKSEELWDLAADMAVEHIIERTAVSRLVLPHDEVRVACFSILGDTPRSVFQVLTMLKEGVFPFTLQQLSRAFAFDEHGIWRKKNAGEGAACRRKWEGLAESSFGRRAGYAAGSLAGEREEKVSLAGASRYNYRAFLSRFTVFREEMKLDTESFDPIYYYFGLEHYGDLPLIEHPECQEVNRLEELVIAIDTSGSCSTETVRRFLEETYAIISTRESFFDRMKVYLIQCDCFIQSVEVIRSAEQWRRSAENITIHGRGGTDFTPVFRYVEELRKTQKLRNLKALIYFTDGDGVYPREKTDYETAFVFLERTEHMRAAPPWARRLVVDDRRREGML